MIWVHNYIKIMNDLLTVLPVLFFGTLFPLTSHASDLMVENCRVTGVTQLSADQVASTLASYLGGQPAEHDYLMAADALTHALRKAGAFAAKVYIHPAQGDEHLTFLVIEGKLTEEGASLGQSSMRVKDRMLKGVLDTALHPGSTLTSAKQERAILLANDLPGVRSSHSTLYPGDEVGEANFEFVPEDANLLEGIVYYDNFGNPDTGRHRWGGNLDVNSPFGFAEHFSFGTNVTDLGTVIGHFDASLPVLSNGLRAGVTLDVLDYRTEGFNGLAGDSQDISVYANFPFIRSRHLNFSGELRLGRVFLEDENNLGTVSDRVVDTIELKLYGNQKDGLLGGGVTTAQVELIGGNVDLDGFGGYKTLDALTAKTSGEFFRATWMVSRLQHLIGDFQLYVEGSGQIASQRMDGSQSISFGGPSHFAGYHAGELLGDEGHMVHTDIRYNVPVDVFGGKQQWQVFYNYGVFDSHALSTAGGFIVPGANDRSYTVQTVGVGFSQKWKRFEIQASMGIPVDNEVPSNLLTNGKTNDVNGWVHAVYRF